MDNRPEQSPNRTLKVLILGGTGMLGHRLWLDLQREHEVWVTVREEHNPFPPAAGFRADRIVHGVDALNTDGILRALGAVQPDLVINSVGLIMKSVCAADPMLALALNALLPHRLSSICGAARIRLVHISTDCVFSGRRGHYVEGDVSDAEDLYGRTKFLGEVDAPHIVTLRTSMIGQELQRRQSLIEWFLSQTGTVRGWRQAIYTGLTTGELARIILRHVIPNASLHGIFHVSSDPIDKYQLLLLAKDAYGREVEIVPDDTLRCDLSLDSTRFHQATGYTSPPWPEMIRGMAAQASFYDRLRSSR